MSDFMAVLAVALLPVCGRLIGAVIGELAHAPRWAIGAALHAATGVAIALVSVELMPRALTNMRQNGVRRLSRVLA